jgi:hypothetical protein
MPCPYNFPQKGKVFAPKDVITTALVVGKKSAFTLAYLTFYLYKRQP